MQRPRLPTVVCVLAGLAECLACAPPPPQAPVILPPAVCPNVGGALGCASDVDCAGGNYCRLDGALCGECAPIACTIEGDCRADEDCDLVRARCERSDRCDVFLPQADCTNAGGGALCAPVDELEQCTLPDVRACEIVPATVVVTDGRAAIVDVLALDGEGRPVPVAPTAITLPPSLQGVARCAGPDPCRGEITATVTDADGGIRVCSAPSLVLPDVPATANRARVIVRDTDTGTPIALARVRIDVDGAPTDALDDAFDDAFDDDDFTDADGIASFSLDGAGVDVAAALLHVVRADAEGYETTVIVEPRTNDVEVLLARVPAAGNIAGKHFASDLAAMPGVGDVRMGLGTLSVPDLVDALDTNAVAGPLLEGFIDISGVTDGEQPYAHLSGNALAFGTQPAIRTGVAMGRPGTRLLSQLGSRALFSDLTSIVLRFGAGNNGDSNDDGVADSDANGDGVVDDDDITGPYDVVLAFAELGVTSMSFGMVGTVTTTEAPLENGTIASFDDGESAQARPSIDASSEIDIVVPPLPAGDNAVFVSLHAFVPGRGFVLLAIRAARDRNGDGLVDMPNRGAVGEGIVRVFVAPNQWLSDRELIVVAGTQRRAEQQNGVMATNRVTTRVTGVTGPTGVPGATVASVVMPPFRTDAPALVEGDVIRVAERDGALLVVNGDALGDVPFRVLVNGDDTRVDLAALGLGAAANVRVWLLATDDGRPSFIAGTLDVARATAAPAWSHELTPE